jgi:hypothetical protein
VPLTLERGDAGLVVFRKVTALTARTVAAPRRQVLQTVGGDWTLRFQPDRGAPEGAMSTPLGDWTQSHNSRVRYLSGAGAYTKTIKAPKIRKGARYLLCLGEVHDIAEVFVNGRQVGLDWRAPYEVDVTEALRVGENHIEIRVVNLWVNRLIGDAQPGAPKVAWTVAPAYSARAPLRPSGLIGPVSLVEVQADR